jgi:hypothetical protein
MRPHVTLSPPHPVPGPLVTLKAHIHSQPFKDRLYVLAVSALVLVTIAIAAGYAIHEWPRWRSGGVGGFDTGVLPLPDRSPFGGAEPAPEAAGTPSGVNRTSLIVTSMLVDAAIFVALGLYLRHEMNRKP